MLTATATQTEALEALNAAIAALEPNREISRNAVAELYVERAFAQDACEVLRVRDLLTAAGMFATCGNEARQEACWREADCVAASNPDDPLIAAEIAKFE